MDEILIVIILYALIVFIDMMPIMKSKNKKLNITYMIVFAFTFIILFLDGLEVDIPSPSIVIKDFITSIIK